MMILDYPGERDNVRKKNTFVLFYTTSLVLCYRINRKLIQRVFKWCKDFPRVISSYQGNATEHKMGKDSYKQHL